MKRIIISNTVETSRQLNSSEINSRTSSAMELSHVRSINSIAGSSQKLPAINCIAAVKKPKKTNKNTSNNWSTSLQRLLHQPPSILPYFVLLSSIAFFVTITVWAWTGEIYEVADFKGEFASIKEIHKPLTGALRVIPSKAFKKGEAIVEIDFQDKSLMLVATLPEQKVGFINKQDKVQIIQDKNFISGTVTSISPYVTNDDKLRSIYKVEVALDNYVTSNKQPIKIHSGQIGSAKIIHQTRIADILLKSINRLSQTN